MCASEQGADGVNRVSARVDKGILRRSILRFAADASSSSFEDDLAVEEPLEIRISGDPIAVTMRTPGDDHRLAAGFLYAEGIIRGAEDLGTVTHCGRPDDEGYGNALDVVPASGAAPQFERLQASRRGTITTAACGVCGRRTVEDLFSLCGPIEDDVRVPVDVLAQSTLRLREGQQVFARTGGTHAAAVLDSAGELIGSAEDVGRHNAVDKVVGALVLRGLTAARDGRPGLPSEGPRPAILVVSGRASFEMVQKAAMARIPVVASVSAASSLAVQLAERMNVTLATFVRGGSFNLCSHPERVIRR